MLNVTQLNGSGSASLDYYSKQDDKGLIQSGALDYYEDDVQKTILHEPAFSSTKANLFQELGFKKSFNAKTFNSLWESCNSNGEFVKPANSTAKTKAFDFTFSAPKEISTLIALLPEEQAKRVNDLFMQSVDEAVKEMTDKLDLVSQGRGKSAPGKQAVASMEKADLLYAKFNHGVNRNLDPQLHAHVIVFNMAQRRSDGKWLNLNTSELMRQNDNYRDIIGNIQRNRFVELLKNEFQFDVENNRNTFEIKGVDEALVEIWSSRKAEIDAATEAAGIEGSKAKNKMAMSTRKGKDDNPSMREQRAEWQVFAKEQGVNVDAINDVMRPLLANEKNRTYKADDISLQAVFERVTAHEAYFTERDLIKACLREVEQLGMSKTERDMLIAKVLGVVQSETNELGVSSNVVHLGERADGTPLFSTTEMLKLEQSINGLAESIVNRQSLVVSQDLLNKHIKIVEQKNGYAYTDEQLKNMNHIGLGSDFAMVQGQAGAGKTTMLEPVVNAWNEAGYKVNGVAISGKVSSAMAELNLNANTIDALLIKLDKTPLTDKDFIVVDESAMVGSRHMEKLLLAVNEAGAKLVLVGDIRQLQPVSAGNPSKTLQSAYTPSQLNEVYRHKQEYGKVLNDAIAKLDGARAIDVLLEEERISVVHDVEQMREKMTSKFFEHFELSNTNSSVMIASTNSAVEALNESARATLIDKGLINPGKGAITVLAKNGQNESMGFKEFAVGDHVVFLKNDKRNDSGPVFNGHIGHITNLDTKTGEIEVELQNGSFRRIDATQYNYINHAYAITGHKSQGATFENTQVEWGSFQNQHSSYVALTRQKQELDVFVSEHQIQQFKAFSTIEDKELAMAKMTFESLDYENKINAIESFGYGEKMTVRGYEDFMLQYGSNREKALIESQNSIDSLKRMVEQVQTEQLKENASDLILAQNAPQAISAEKAPVRLKELEKFVSDNKSVVERLSVKTTTERMLPRTEELFYSTLESVKKTADSFKEIVASTHAQIDIMKHKMVEQVQSSSNVFKNGLSMIKSQFEKQIIDVGLKAQADANKPNSHVPINPKIEELKTKQIVQIERLIKVHSGSEKAQEIVAMLEKQNPLFVRRVHQESLKSIIEEQTNLPISIDKSIERFESALMEVESNNAHVEDKDFDVQEIAERVEKEAQERARERAEEERREREELQQR